ncbi:MAG: helix-turn-helix domain-containing protein [Pirellulaceae bacterium]|nr:helix-turn-helix domain-containing protein [Pirellulaceae bacterium]
MTSTARTIEKLITTSDLSRALGVSRETVRHLSIHDHLPHVLIGRRRRYRLESVRKWLLDRESAQADAK